MTKKLLFAGMILLAVAVVMIAADNISGKWGWETQGRDGTPRPASMELKAEGAKLTGTVTGGMGGRGGGGGGAPGGGAPGGGAPPAPPQISNGKVDGNNISFEVTREFGGNTMTTKYVGVVSGSTMNLKITSPGRGGGDPTTVDVVAKKQ